MSDVDDDHDDDTPWYMIMMIYDYDDDDYYYDFNIELLSAILLPITYNMSVCLCMYVSYLTKWK